MSDNNNKNSTSGINFDLLKNLNIPPELTKMFNNLDMSQLQSMMSNFNFTNENPDKMKEQAEAMLSKLNLSPESIDNIRNQFGSMLQGFNSNNVDQSKIIEQTEALFAKFNVPPEIVKNAESQFGSIMSMLNQDNADGGESKNQDNSKDQNQSQGQTPFSPETLSKLAGQIQSMFSQGGNGNGSPAGLNSQFGSIAEKLKSQYESLAGNLKSTPINTDFSGQIDTLLSLMNIPDENREKVRQQFTELSTRTVLSADNLFKSNPQSNNMLGDLMSSLFNQKK